jgi:hypothetical protein
VVLRARIEIGIIKIKPALANDFNTRKLLYCLVFQIIENNLPVLSLRADLIGIDVSFIFTKRKLVKSFITPPEKINIWYVKRVLNP